jgi:hypothetical protein
MGLIIVNMVQWDVHGVLVSKAITNHPYVDDDFSHLW